MQLSISRQKSRSHLSSNRAAPVFFPSMRAVLYLFRVFVLFYIQLKSPCCSCIYFRHPCFNITYHTFSRTARLACSSFFAGPGKPLHGIIPSRRVLESLSLYLALQQLHIMTVVFHRLSILILCLLGFYVRARGARDKHIIYPREDLSLLESVQFTEHLIELAGPEGNVYTSRNPGHWHLPSETINFWWANVNSTIYEVLRNDPRV